MGLKCSRVQVVFRNRNSVIAFGGFFFSQTREYAFVQLVHEEMSHGGVNGAPSFEKHRHTSLSLKCFFFFCDSNEYIIVLLFWGVFRVSLHYIAACNVKWNTSDAASHFYRDSLY